MGNEIDVSELPPRILLDLNSYCNLKCPMCIVHSDIENPKVKQIIRQRMSADQARQILDEVMAAQPAVGPSLWSEPLMAKDILVHLQNMKARGMNVAINTNGLLLDKKMANELVALEIDAITISIDAVTKETLQKIRGIDKLEKIENNVHQLIMLRGDRDLPRIGVSFTKQCENISEHDDFIEKWMPIVDFVRTGEVFEEGRFPEINLDRKQRTPCPELYTTMAIHTNGDVSICCLDGFKDHRVGNALEQGVRAVWQGEEMQKVRRYHENGEYHKVPLCTNCDRWAASKYSEEVVDGILIRKSSEYTYYNNLEKIKNWKKNVRHSAP